jgi:5'-nucleotidase
MRRILIGLAAGLLLAVSGPAGAEELALIYTNSANGNIDSCNCPGHPTGGLVRRATVIARVRKEHPSRVMLFDTGDLFPVEPNKLKIEYTLKMMGKLGYDLVGVGDQDFALGLDYLAQAIKRHDLNFISGNLYMTDKEKNRVRMAPPNQLFMFGETWIGVTQITPPEAFKFYPANLTEGLEIADPEKELAGNLNEIKDRSTILIVLSHGGMDYDLALAEKHPEIDIIVGGHDQFLTKDPVKKGKTIIVQAGAKGDHVGILTLQIKDGKITSCKNELVLLDKEVADDPDQRKMIEAYDEDVTKSLKKVILTPDK